MLAFPAETSVHVPVREQLKEDLWGLENTLQDPTDPNLSMLTRNRNKARGMAASLVSAASFSLSVNGSLDKFGLIDPSTSTVFIGMFPKITDPAPCTVVLLTLDPGPLRSQA